MSKVKFFKAILAVVALVLTNFSSLTVFANEGDTVVKVALIGDNSLLIWDKVNENLQEEGITIEPILFDDGQFANIALKDGDVNLTSFGHYAYYDQEIADQGYEFSYIGETFISPLNIFSKTIEDISEIKEGDTILIPNNITNTGRALLVLQDAGLIKVDPEKGDLPEVTDITENPKKLEIVEVDPAIIFGSLEDVAAGITNAGQIIDNGWDPVEDAIYHVEINPDEDTFKPYINVIVARSEDENSEIYDKIVEAYHQDNVKQVISKDLQNAHVPVW